MLPVYIANDAWCSEGFYPAYFKLNYEYYAKINAEISSTLHFYVEDSDSRAKEVCNSYSYP
jgi:hypothetical protein